MKQDYNQQPTRTIKGPNRNLEVFASMDRNIDNEVVASFGDEWEKFHSFDEEDLKRASSEYFDILDDTMINKSTYAADIGCGSGRWTKCLLPRVGFVEAIDPSKALLAADVLLGQADNVRLSMASTDNIPFPDATFDFVMSIGVLHHIPDTKQAMRDCVKKVKPGGYFYTYLYYALDNRGLLTRLLFRLSDMIRRAVSSLPGQLKKFTCDVLAVVFYMPFILTGRFLKFLGLKKLANALPLSIYQNKTFYIIRNDSLDRFGTSLEQRFTKVEIHEMMTQAGLTDVVISPNPPYWHAVGKRSS